MGSDLHETEPLDYQLVTSSNFNEWTVNGVTRTVGFVTNSPDAGGYIDDKFLLIRDQTADPRFFVEYVLHEGLHGVFPDLAEERVSSAAKSLTKLLIGVLSAKGIRLPEIKPLARLDAIEQRQKREVEGE